MSKNSTISITYKFKGDNSGLKDLVSNVERMQKAFKDGVQPAEQLKTSLINFNQISQSFAAIGASISQLNSVVQDLSAAYSVQVEAETKLQTVMAQRMNATASQVQGIKDLCSAQQQLGVIGDEVQLAGAQQLATFLTTNTALRTLIPAMNNLVAQQKGLNATQGDTVAVANLMGKALQGQTSALRRVGITFSEAEEKALKNGNEQERAAMLAKIITNNVGEMNAALAKTDAGRSKQLSNALGDVKEMLGGIVSGVAPYMSFISALVATTANAGRAAAAVRGLYSATLGANGVMKFCSASSVAAALGMNAAGVAARFLAAGLRMILASVGIGLVIQGISMAVDYFTSSTQAGADAAEDFASAEDSVKQATEAANKALADTRAQLETDIAVTKDYHGTKEQEKKLVSELNDRYGETMGYFSSVSDWYNTLVSNSEAYCKQMEREANARMLANQISEIEQQKRDIIYNQDGSKRKYSTTREKKLVISENDRDRLRKDDSGKWYFPSEKEIAEEQFVNLGKKQNFLRNQLAGMYSQPVVPMPVKGASAPPRGASNAGGSAHSRSLTDTHEKEKTVLEQIEDQIRANQTAALTSSDEELAKLKESTQALVKERDMLRERQEALVAKPKEVYVPPQVDEIKTYEELDKALQHYNDKLRKAQPEERAEINVTINKLQDLRTAWDNALNPQPPESTELDSYIDSLVSNSTAKFKSMSSPLEGMDFNSLISGYEEIKKVLGGLDGDITAEQRESLRKAAGEYAKYAKNAAKSYSTLKNGWGNLKGVTGGIDSLRDAVDGSGDAWDRVSASIDAAFQIYEGISGIIRIVKDLTAATQAQTVATEVQTVAEVAGGSADAGVAAEKVANSSAVTTANIAEAASGVMKANSSIPIVGIALAGAGVAALLAMMASLPKFADGGIAYGPTLGLFGEYAGAGHNPEVVAPLDKLQAMLAPQGGGGYGRVVFRIAGRDLVGVLANETNISSKTGKKTNIRL